MNHAISPQLRPLQIYFATTLLLFAALAASAFRDPPKPKNLGQITAERIDIVDADGTLRLVISNKERMHPGVIDGKVLQRKRPYAGLIFFNDQGDEAGGLVLKGRAAAGGQGVADAGLMFDQLGQDQTIGFDYSEENGVRTAGFKVWDPPETPHSEIVAKRNAAMAIENDAEREAALAELRATAPKLAERVFVGKTRDRAASVRLADAQGRTRLVLKVDASGTASIEFLDGEGKVIQRVGPGQ